jgi:hypothetical protein
MIPRMSLLIVLACGVLQDVLCFQVSRGTDWKRPSSVCPEPDRRRFLGVIGTFGLVAGSSGVLSLAFPSPSLAAATDKPVVIKVSPVSHTFITSSGSPKPIRENDATRFFTNARVVFLIEGSGANPALASEVVDLTIQRKADHGAGVTPGEVRTLKSASVNAILDEAKQLTGGDVLLVGPILSGGTAADGKLLADTASALGTFVGGKTGGGVISVLLDGPKDGLKFDESGYKISDLLWYSLP